MRIERLAEENRRTQGPRRRDELRRTSRVHLQAIEQLVITALSARPAAAPATAALLGAGACTELPLERIVRACERVVLADLDAPGMGRGRDELPPALRSRVTLAPGDLTGGVSRALAEQLRAQPWADLVALGAPSSLAPVEAAAACLARCPVPAPPHVAGLERAAFGVVVSSLTLTQLFSLPLLDVLDALTLHAPAVAALRELSPHYVEAARDFRRRVALAHLDLLAALLVPDGVAALITDVTGYLLAAPASPHAAEPEDSLLVLPPDVLDLDADVAARFERVGEPRRWRWIATQPASGMPGRAYGVVGMALRRR
jgi:hypothetical protein